MENVVVSQGAVTSENLLASMPSRYRLKDVCLFAQFFSFHIALKLSVPAPLYSISDA
jgi:hypothetical protein